MAATNATFIFLGKSGQTYTVEAYVPDAVATRVTFNPSGLAVSTSTDYWKAPEECMLVDIISVGAPTAVGATLTLSGALYTGKTFRWNNQLASLPNRMKQKVPIPAGEQVGALQF
jgi:hypothetical protein